MVCFVGYTFTSVHWKNSAFMNRKRICKNSNRVRMPCRRDYLVAVLPKTPTPQKDPVEEKEPAKKVSVSLYLFTICFMC